MKKIIYIVACAYVLLCFVFSCEDKEKEYVFPKDKYFYDIPEVPVMENYVVGVSYDTKSRDSLHNVWWDNGILPKGDNLLYTGTPELGEYDTKYDPNVLRQHLEWGREAGIDFFILSWGGHGYNDTILSEWEKMWKANQALPKVVIRFDPGYRFKGADTLMAQKPDGSYKFLHMDSLRRDFDSLYQHVISHDFAYKKRDNNKPVMILTNFTNRGHITSAYNFTNFLRGVGNDIWIMAELQGRLTSPERWGYHAKNGYEGAVSDGYVAADSIRAFDAFFITDVSTDMFDRNMSLYSFTDYNFLYWQECLAPLGKEYVPTVMPAFDNTVNDANSGTYIIPRWNGQANSAYPLGAMKTEINFNFSNVKKNPYQEFANVAKRTADKNSSRIVIVYSWNNFVNGTSLEPTQEYGHDYLNYTKQFFKK
jgi:hypothetical protein